MKLREELDNRSVEKKSIIAPVNYFTNQEKEELFHILRKEAVIGLTTCLITDYILAFPILVSKQNFESILTDEGLFFEYMNNGLVCLVKWGKDYK